MSITIELPDSKREEFLEYIANLDYIKNLDRDSDLSRITEDIKQGLHDIIMHQRGNNTLLDAREAISES